MVLSTLFCVGTFKSPLNKPLNAVATNEEDHISAFENKYYRHIYDVVD